METTTGSRARARKGARMRLSLVIAAVAPADAAWARWLRDVMTSWPAQLIILFLFAGLAVLLVRHAAREWEGGARNRYLQVGLVAGGVFFVLQFLFAARWSATCRGRVAVRHRVRGAVRAPAVRVRALHDHPAQRLRRRRVAEFAALPSTGSSRRRATEATRREHLHQGLQQARRVRRSGQRFPGGTEPQGQHWERRCVQFGNSMRYDWCVTIVVAGEGLWLQACRRPRARRRRSSCLGPGSTRRSSGGCSGERRCDSPAAILLSCPSPCGSRRGRRWAPWKRRGGLEPRPAARATAGDLTTVKAASALTRSTEPWTDDPRAAAPPGAGGEDDRAR